MTITDDKIQERASAPSRQNDLSAETYEFIKKILIEEFGSKVDIFLQGSYSNSTNIKKDSDIDIVLCYKDIYYYEIGNLSEEDQKIFRQNASKVTYNFSQFKDDVELYSQKKFGTFATRKNKCIRIKGNGTRVDTDIVPCFVHRRYSNLEFYDEGIQFITDGGEKIITFPKQHKENGEKKNVATNTKYKSIVRILKNCKKLLVETNQIDENLISSFFIECLVWNIPNNYFDEDGYIKPTNSVIRKAYADMSDDLVEYAEINDLFRLFPRSSISKNDVKKFIEEAYSLLNP